MIIVIWYDIQSILKYNYNIKWFMIISIIEIYNGKESKKGLIT